MALPPSVLFLTKVNRKIAEGLSGLSVVGVFRFVDDFLLVSRSQGEARDYALVSCAIDLFQKKASDLTFMGELPQHGHMKFLDLSLSKNVSHK